MSQYGTNPVPSTTSDFQLPAEPPAWPKVVGIISIVLAALGIPCSGCVSIGSLGGGALYEWGRQKQIAAKMPDPGEMPSVFQPGVLDVLSAGIWFLGVIVLLVAGIMTVRRKVSGRAAHLAYAAVSIVGTLMYTVSAIMKSQAVADWISHNPGHPFLKQPGAAFAGNPIGTIVVSLLCLAYPIFIVIWFGAMGKRPEVGAMSQEPLV
jgi:hypothetical protein